MHHFYFIYFEKKILSFIFLHLDYFVCVYVFGLFINEPQHLRQIILFLFMNELHHILLKQTKKLLI